MKSAENTDNITLGLDVHEGSCCATDLKAITSAYREIYLGENNLFSVRTVNLKGQDVGVLFDSSHVDRYSEEAKKPTATETASDRCPSPRNSSLENLISSSSRMRIVWF